MCMIRALVRQDFGLVFVYLPGHVVRKPVVDDIPAKAPCMIGTSLEEVVSILDKTDTVYVIDHTPIDYSLGGGEA